MSATQIRNKTMTKPKLDGGNRGGKGIPSESKAPNVKPTEEFWAWQQEAKCVGVDTEKFFLPYAVRGSDKQRLNAEAKAVCAGCPVVEQCLTHALSVPEEYGVWGGLTPEERKLIIRQNKLNNKLNIKTTIKTTKD